MTHLDKITHKDLQQNVATLAKHKGWRVQFWWRSFHSGKGFLDLVLARPPRLIFAEIKIPPDKLSKEQQEWYEIWGKYKNIERYVWLPEDWVSGNIEKILE